MQILITKGSDPKIYSIKYKNLLQMTDEKNFTPRGNLRTFPKVILCHTFSINENLIFLVKSDFK